MPSNGGDLILMVPVHVDDGLSVTNSLPLYNWFKAELSKDLEVINLGTVSIFLVIHIHHNCPRNKIYLSQKSFITSGNNKFIGSFLEKSIVLVVFGSSP